MDRFKTFLYANFNRYWEPWHYAPRWRRREGSDVAQESELLPSVSIRLGQTGACGCAACVPLIRRYDLAYGKLRSPHRTSPEAAKLKFRSSATLHTIPFMQYARYADYQTAMRRESGNFMRDAARAKRAGYRVQDVQLANYSPDILAIHRSAKLRSFGVYLDAFLMRLEHLGGLPQHYAEIAPPQCTQHWEKLIGVFLPKAGYRQGALQTEQQLVGYARLYRIGNTVAYRDFIGHAEHVSHGVMKQLHLHILEWLLERSDPLVQGIEQITYGAVERGSDGLYFWKKKALFKPYLASVEPQRLPLDFKAEEYLRLNPDVKGSRADLEAHYVWHGRAEKRLYKVAVPSDFDPVQYLALNPDVQCGVREADVHYTLHGREENRPYRAASDGAYPVVGPMSYG